MVLWELMILLKQVICWNGQRKQLLQKGYIKNAKLYVDNYPNVKLNCGDEESKVNGYIVTPNETNKFKDMLLMADQIEGYDSYYENCCWSFYKFKWKSKMCCLF